MPKTSSLLEPVQGPATQSNIAGQIRRQIVEGRVPLGERLPTRSELRKFYGVTNTTVQRAFDVLIDQGFIRTEGYRGTFVSEAPPHLTRYALAFPLAQEKVDTIPFWTKLRRQAENEEAAGNYRISPFYDINHLQYSADYKRLIHEMETHQLAGIIFTTSPLLLEGSPLMKALNVPLVAITTGASEINVPEVMIDYDSFIGRALEYVAKCGRTKIAILAPPLPDAHREFFFRQVAAHGLASESCWWVPVNVAAPQFTSTYTHLLMRGTPAARPDALIIADDTFVPHALQGLQDAGVLDEVELVAQCNFPVAESPAVPMKRLGFSVPGMFRSCLDLMDRMRAGESVPDVTPAHAVFEHEVHAEREVPAMQGMQRSSSFGAES